MSQLRAPRLVLVMLLGAAVAASPGCKQGRDATTPPPKVPPKAAATTPVSPTARVDSATFDERLVGEWEIQKWGVAYSIQKQGDLVTVSGADVANDEDFEVRHVSWDGKALKASFRMPSTKHETHSVLVVTDKDHLDDVYTGSAIGHDIWTRKGTAPAPSSASTDPRK